MSPAKPAESAEATAAPASGEASSGQSPDQGQAAREEAGQRFQRGLGFYQDGDYALALIEFDRAYQLVPDYRVLYNIGQVSIQLARFARARLALEQYVAEGGAAIPTDRADEVDRDLRMLRDRTAHLELTTTPAGAEVVIDDRSYGETPLAAPLLLDAGEHQVVFKKKGFQTVTRRVVLAGAEHLPLSVELAAVEQGQVVIVQKPEPTVTDVPPAADTGARGPHPAVFTWIATGVLATAAVTTGILGLEAKARYDEAFGQPDMGEEATAAASEARALFLACDILTISAAAAFGTSLYLTLHKREPKVKSAAGVRTSAAAEGALELMVLPHAVRLRGTF